MNKCLFYALAAMSFVALCGYAQAAEKRSFREMNTGSQQEWGSENSVQQDMKQEMPDDDIHAAFRKGQGSMANMENMPNDDIHRQFKMGSMADQQALMGSVAKVPLSWTIPEGWTEEKGGGMRIATFKAGEGDLAVETSVISLAGAAGGMAANVGRWMGQLGLDVPSPEKLDEFISTQQKITTPSGLSVTVVDFTQMQSDAPKDTSSMIAAVVEGGASQIFIKMTGSKQAVLKSFDAFRSLVGSLKVE